MMNSSNWNQQLEDELNGLIDQLLDECIEIAERKRLEELVIEYPAARKIYLRAAELDSLMYQIADEELAPSASEELASKPVGLPVDPPPATGFIGSRLNSILLFAFLGLVVFGALLWLRFSPSASAHGIVQFQSEDNIEWNSDEHFQQPKAGVLHAGTYKFSSGNAKLLFPSGASVDLSGPVEFKVQDNDTLRLVSGAAQTDVPESAIGFTVLVPNVAYVDFGTRAKISVRDDGSSSVRVDEGLVKVSVRRQDGKEVLSELIPAGHERSVDRSGMIVSTEDFVFQQKAGEDLLVQAELVPTAPGFNQSFTPAPMEGATGPSKSNGLATIMSDATGIPQETNFSVQEGESVKYKLQFADEGRFQVYARYRATDNNANSFYLPAKNGVAFFDQLPTEFIRLETGDEWQIISLGQVEVTARNVVTWNIAPRETGLEIDGFVFSLEPASEDRLAELEKLFSSE